MRPARAAAVMAAVVVIAQCGGSASRESAEQHDMPAAVIVAPADGDTLTGPAVRVVLAAHNVTVAPAGTDLPNAAHHHLFVNREPTEAGQVIPAGPGIAHLGGGQSDHELSGIIPGEYTVIAVLGDPQHVRVAGARTDTVRFTVVPQ